MHDSRMCTHVNAATEDSSHTAALKRTPFLRQDSIIIRVGDGRFFLGAMGVYIKDNILS